MTFLMTLTSKLYSRFAQLRAHGDSGQELVEYGLIAGGFIVAGAVVYLIVSH